MTESQYEYDSKMGGSVQLPEQLQTYKFAAERVTEIKSLLGAINNPNQTKLVFQTLPKHMRRRAMSHNPKRLPRKYRIAHISQMRKSGVAIISKRPSRKYRRKPSNLMRAYQRRQRSHTWLETHIWHAKRFKMIERWGYKLAQASCDKTFRSSYRASAKHCLLQDISYNTCIEIIANVDSIKTAFAQMTNPKCGLSICAKTYLNGNREGSIDLFRKSCYPLGALGRVQFIWKPIPTEDENLETNSRQLWLFVHPLFSQDVITELCQILLLSKKTTETKNHLNTADSQSQKYVSQTGNIQLTELKDAFNKFRLTGPLSQAVLSKAFKCKLSEENAEWVKVFQQNNIKLHEAHESQSKYWSSIENVQCPTELFPNMVLALNIEDPRVNRPIKRTKAIPENIVYNTFEQRFSTATIQIPNDSAVSAIWSTEIRSIVTQQKMSTREFCQQRNKHALVPGERCDFENRLQPVPVLLIQRPGSQNGNYKRLGYGGGWDIIVPAGYGLSTWMCLIMWGARAGGIRETETICREGGSDEFLPDTPSAQQENEHTFKQLINEYFRKPQNKRPNYKKLSIASPFKCAWSQLVREWNHPQTNDDYFVIRERKILEQLKQILLKRLPFSALDSLYKNSLIPIHLKMVGRGSPGDCAIICVPKPSDLKRDVRMRKVYNNEPIYTEPLRSDPQEQERKRLRVAHQKLLKRLRRRRVRTKKRKQETSEKRVLIAKPGTAKIIAEQISKIRELWLPASPVSIRNQCTREVLGYLTKADFSLAEARVAGVGYITMNGLKKLVSTCSKWSSGPSCTVLVRGTNTRQYRFAKLIIKDD